MKVIYSTQHRGHFIDALENGRFEIREQRVGLTYPNLNEAKESIDGALEE